MTRRKRLPYSANQALDNERMYLADMRHLVLPILREPPNEAELLKTLALLLDKIHQALHTLDEIQTEQEP